MIKYTQERRVRRSAEETFDVIGTNLYENHPKWEKEVVEVQPITPGPIGVGSRAVMVRREFGRTSEVEYVVTEFEPGRILASHDNDPSMEFDIRFEVTPIDGESCTLAVEVRAQPNGWMKIFEPIMRIVMPKRGNRITSSLVALVESTPART